MSDNKETSVMVEIIKRLPIPAIVLLAFIYAAPRLMYAINAVAPELTNTIVIIVIATYSVAVFIAVAYFLHSVASVSKAGKVAPRM